MHLFRRLGQYKSTAPRLKHWWKSRTHQMTCRTWHSSKNLRESQSQGLLVPGLQETDLRSAGQSLLNNKQRLSYVKKLRSGIIIPRGRILVKHLSCRPAKALLHVSERRWHVASCSQHAAVLHVVCATFLGLPQTGYRIDVNTFTLAVTEISVKYCATEV